MHVAQNLTLRTAPDPHSDKVLEEIPKDALVELTYQGGGFPFGCRKAPSSATWCPVTYESHNGWVNAFYLKQFPAYLNRWDSQ
jgi:hypothetical protein